MEIHKTEKMKHTIRGAKLVRVQYKAKQGKEYTKNQVIKTLQKLSKQMKEDGFYGKMSINLLYPVGWLQGKATFVGSKINIADEVDCAESGYHVSGDETFKRVHVYLWKLPRSGGESENNDCLYECLEQVIPRLPKCYKTALHFKAALGLERSDPVDVKFIEEIEKDIPNLSINVSGDATYISTKKTKFTVYLKLLNGHYSFEKFSHKKFNARGVRFEECEPIVYTQSQKDPDSYSIFDGKKRYSVKKGIAYGYMRDYRNGQIWIKHNNVATLRAFYEDFVKNAEEIKEETDGFINMYKTGSFKTTAIDLFTRLHPQIQAEPLDPIEERWISEAMQGSIAWGNKYEGEGYKYDVCSMYPYIMQHQLFAFPIKKGVFKELTQQQFDELPFPEFGIYNVEIENTEPRLFRTNPEGKYTHYDLMRAKELGFEMKIKEGEANFLYYPPDTRVNGNHAFRKFVEYLFPLKQKGIKFAKLILNSLWGGLCQKNILALNSAKLGTIEIKDDQHIESVTTLPNNEVKIRVSKDGKYYETNYARIGPFLLASGRKMISEIMEPYIDDIQRVHTDGFISTNEIDFSKKKTKSAKLSNVIGGNNLGNIKYEGYCERMQIVNVNKIIDPDTENQAIFNI